MTEQAQQIVRVYQTAPEGTRRVDRQCPGVYTPACKKCPARRKCRVLKAAKEDRRTAAERWPHIFCKHRVVYPKTTGCKKDGGTCRASKCRTVDPAHI